jgi:hypothetical protein
VHSILDSGPVGYFLLPSDVSRPLADLDPGVSIEQDEIAWDSQLEESAKMRVEEERNKRAVMVNMTEPVKR